MESLRRAQPVTLVATTEGIARRWAERPLRGESAVGSRFSVYFAGPQRPSAVMEVTSDRDDEVTWRVVDGPDSWIDTLITFVLRPFGDAGTTLLFTHAGWREASEFMSGCSTNWGAYLTSLKLGAEGLGFRPYPQGEISRWGESARGRAGAAVRPGLTVVLSAPPSSPTTRPTLTMVPLTTAPLRLEPER